MSDVGLEVVQHIFREMQIDPEWSQREDCGFVWWGHRLAQRVWAEPCFEDDGFTISRIHARTDLATDFTGTDEQLLALAPFLRVSSLSGIVRTRDDPGRLQLACSMYVHAQTKHWIQKVMALAVSLQVVEAHLMADNLASALGGSVAVSAHPGSGPRLQHDGMLNVVSAIFIPEGVASSRFRGEEMLLALNSMEQTSVLANGDEKRLTSEFPFGGRTSLLRLLTDEPHQLLGNGLVMRLSLPITVPEADEAKGVELALKLNERELREFTRTHFLGSWCTSQWGLTYVTFVPNTFARSAPRPTPMLATGMYLRARWVTKEVFEAGWDLEEASRSKVELYQALGQIAPEEITRIVRERRPAPREDHTDPLPDPELTSKLTSAMVEAVRSRGTPELAPATESEAERRIPWRPSLAALYWLSRVKEETQGDFRRASQAHPGTASLLTLSELVPLGCWGIFNPYGPTATTVLLGRNSPEDDYLLFDVTTNPFMTVQVTLRGWHPATLQAAQLEETLVDITRTQSGNQVEDPLLNSAPSFVIIMPWYGLSEEQWKRVFREVLQTNVQEDLVQERTLLREYWWRPWDRASAQLEKARKACIQKGTAESSASPVLVQFRQSDFEDWWQLVTHPEHLRAEFKEMPAAWTGSIEHVAPNLAITGVEEGLGFHGRFFQPPTETG